MAKGKASETENELFARRLREVMKERGLKAMTLSAKIEKEQGITIQRQSISQYMVGQNNPDTKRLSAICKALDVSADYLLGISDVQNTNPNVLDIHNATHLSEKSVISLLNLSDSDAKGLSFLLEDSRFIFSCAELSRLSALIHQTKQRIVDTAVTKDDFYNHDVSNTVTLNDAEACEFFFQRIESRFAKVLREVSGIDGLLLQREVQLENADWFGILEEDLNELYEIAHKNDGGNNA